MMEEQVDADVYLDKLKRSNWHIAAQQAIDTVAAKHNLTKEEMNIICALGDWRAGLIKETWEELARILKEKVK